MKGCGMCVAVASLELVNCVVCVWMGTCLQLPNIVLEAIHFCGMTMGTERQIS